MHGYRLRLDHRDDRTQGGVDTEPLQTFFLDLDEGLGARPRCQQRQCLRQRRQDHLCRRDGEARRFVYADIGKLCGRQVHDATGSPCRTLQCRVVQHDRDAVGTQLHIELHPAGTRPQGGLQSLETVFRIARRIAAVRHQQRDRCHHLMNNL